jgi:CO/xanthine dehydrogenase Mo-binding subunit
VRQNAYWVGIAEVAVNPATGVVLVNKFTIGVDSGKVINLRQLAKGVQPRRIPLTLG